MSIKEVVDFFGDKKVLDGQLFPMLKSLRH